MAVSCGYIDAAASRLVSLAAAPLCCPSKPGVKSTVLSTSLKASTSRVSSPSTASFLLSPSAFRRSTSPLTSATSFRKRASFLSKPSSSSSSLLRSFPLTSSPSFLRHLLFKRYPCRLLAMRVAELGSRSPEGRKWVRASSGSIR